MSKEFTLESLKAHKSEDSCWIALSGNVYDVTKFLHDHPGGMDTIIDSSGQDATDSFEAVGHSKQARDMLPKYLMGTIKEDPNAPKGKASKSSSPAAGGKASDSGSSGFMMAVVIALSAIGLGLYLLSTGQIPGLK